MFRDPYDPWGQPRARPLRPLAIPVARPAPQPARPLPPPAPPPEEPAETKETAKDDPVRLALEELAATRRRLEREHERVLDETRAGVVERMLPVLDSLDRTLSSASSQDAASGGDGLLEGVRLVRAQFEDALARSGLARIESRGARFDPSAHEAIGVVEVGDPELDGVVIDEWQRGYRLGDRMVRAPKVRVGRLAR